MTTCIGCGCTDEDACEGGCSWLAKSMSERAGLCSSCGLGEIGAVTLDEAAEACDERERDWESDRAEHHADWGDVEQSPLILPGDPEYYNTFRGGR